jgi:hypothetical protein
MVKREVGGNTAIRHDERNFPRMSIFYFFENIIACILVT